MKKPTAVSNTVETNHATLCPLAAKTRKPGLAASIFSNIGPIPPYNVTGR